MIDPSIINRRLKQFQYESPPGSGGNDGALPTAWVQDWKSKWRNLTSAQSAAFEAFPQDLIWYIGDRRWRWEVRSTPFPGEPGPPTPYIELPVEAGLVLGGMQVYMNERSQAKISQLQQDVKEGIVAQTAFSAVNGVRQLSASDVTALYGYVRRYYNATYTIAGVLTAQVNAGTLTARPPIDLAFAMLKVV